MPVPVPVPVLVPVPVPVPVPVSVPALSSLAQPSLAPDVCIIIIIII